MAIRLQVTDAEIDAPEPERDLEFAKGPVLLGRSRSNHVVFGGPLVSRVHFELHEEAGGWVVLARGSLLPTLLNGEQLERERARPVADGDRIVVGGLAVEISIPQPVHPGRAPAAAGAAPVPGTAWSASPQEATWVQGRGEGDWRRPLREWLEIVLDAGAAAPAGGVRLPLVEEGREYVLGRSSDCDLCLQHGAVSRRHLRLRREGDQVVLTDLGSKNPARLDGVPVRGIVRMQIGGILQIGPLRLALVRAGGMPPGTGRSGAGSETQLWAAQDVVPPAPPQPPAPPRGPGRTEMVAGAGSAQGPAADRSPRERGTEPRTGPSPLTSPAATAPLYGSADPPLRVPPSPAPAPSPAASDPAPRAPAVERPAPADEQAKTEALPFRGAAARSSADPRAPAVPAPPAPQAWPGPAAPVTPSAPDPPRAPTPPAAHLPPAPPRSPPAPFAPVAPVAPFTPVAPAASRPSVPPAPQSPPAPRAPLSFEDAQPAASRGAVPAGEPSAERQPPAPPRVPAPPPRPSASTSAPPPRPTDDHPSDTRTTAPGLDGAREPGTEPLPPHTRPDRDTILTPAAPPPVPPTPARPLPSPPPPTGDASPERLADLFVDPARVYAPQRSEVPVWVLVLVSLLVVGGLVALWAGMK